MAIGSEKQSAFTEVYGELFVLPADTLDAVDANPALPIAFANAGAYKNCQLTTGAAAGITPNLSGTYRVSFSSTLGNPGSGAVAGVVSVSLYADTTVVAKFTSAAAMTIANTAGLAYTLNFTGFATLTAGVKYGVYVSHAGTDGPVDVDYASFTIERIGD